MKKFFYSLLVVSIMVSGCAPTIYVAPNFEQVRKKHKTVGILPFDVLITAKKLPKGMTQEMVNEKQKSTGFSIQSNAYTYFLKKQGADKYTVEFQDVDKTNSLLAKAGITYDNIKSKGKDELAALLGVDAVISGKATMQQPMSEAGAIVVGLLVGAWGNTNKVDVSMTIHDKNDGKLLWKYDYEASGSVGSSPENLTKQLMYNVAKKFPYKKTK